MEGETSLLAMSMGSHGWVTWQNTFCISGFAGVTKHPADSSETQTQLFLIAVSLGNSSRTQAGPFTTSGPHSMTEKSTQKPNALHIHILKPKLNRQEPQTWV